jgi:hypothetical protein
VLPIFNKLSSNTSSYQKAENVIYVGGAQTWQNVDLMVNTINKTYKKYRFTVLTHNPDAFHGINPSASRRTTLKSVSSAQVADFYQTAGLGLILRDDIHINNVACPTKMIDYLGNGVVPVVLSPNIGDFKELGYSYFKLEDFINKNITQTQLDVAAKKNLLVYKQLRVVIKNGEGRLKTIFRNLDSIKTTDSIKKLQTELIKINWENKDLKKQNTANEAQIDTQKKMIKQYAESVNYYQKTLEDILHSKRWIILEIMRNPLAINKYFRKWNK